MSIRGDASDTIHLSQVGSQDGGRFTDMKIYAEERPIRLGSANGDDTNLQTSITMKNSNISSKLYTLDKDTFQ